MSIIKKIGELHIPLKYIIAFLILVLIVCYFFKEQVLFERILMILIPFLIGSSVKVGLLALQVLV